MGSHREMERLRRKADVKTNEAHILATVKLAQQTYAAKGRTKRIGFIAFCLKQIGFCGWQTWLLQCALLFCAGISMRATALWNVRSLVDFAPFALRALAILSVLTALPTLYRSNRYRMLETEIAARAGYARLLCSRLALVAAGDILLLSSALAFTVLTTNIGVAPALYCILPPYLIMLAALLTLLRRIPLRALPYALIALGVVMLIAAVAYSALSSPSIAAIPYWRALCAALIPLCVTQLVKLRRESGFADVQF